MTYNLDHLNSLNKAQLAALYFKEFRINAEHKNYNTIVTALHLGKRIKYVTEQDEKSIKEQFLKTSAA